MRASVREILRNFAYFTDRALIEPVIITKNGRDRIVMISAEEYAMRRDLIDAGSETPDEQTVRPGRKPRPAAR